MCVVWLSDEFFAGAALTAGQGSRRARQHKRDGEEKTGDDKALSHEDTSAEFRNWLREQSRHLAELPSISKFD